MDLVARGTHLQPYGRACVEAVVDSFDETVKKRTGQFQYFRRVVSVPLQPPVCVHPLVFRSRLHEGAEAAAGVQSLIGKTRAHEHR